MKRCDIKIKKADEEELRREDDVLLQSVPFLSTIVFVFVNLFIEDQLFKTVLSVFIATCAISFYALRALGKIKQSSKYRHYSMMLLAFLFGSYFASLVTTFADKTNLMYSVIFGIDSAIVISLIVLFDYVFSKRYGYNSITLWESFLRK